VVLHFFPNPHIPLRSKPANTRTHTVIGAPIPLSTKTLDFYFPSTSKVTFSFDIPQKEDQVIYLPSLLERSPLPLTNKVPFSFFHFLRFQGSPLSDKMTYFQYCVWENQIAQILFSYLQDVRHHWTIQIPPFFLYQDGIQKYGTEESVHQNTKWITPSVQIGNPDEIVFLAEEVVTKDI